MRKGCMARRKAARFSILCLSFFIAFCSASLKISKRAASAGGEELSPAELIVSFDGDEGKTERSGDVTIADGKAVLKNGGKVQSTEKFGALRLYVSAKIEGTLKIGLGNAAILCGEDGIFAIGAAETYSARRTVRGETLVSLTLFDRYAEIGIRTGDEPQEKLYDAVFKAVLTEETNEKIAPCFSAESGRIEIDYFEIFSLEPSVPGESEDYDPSHDSSAFAVKPIKDESEKKKGCASSLGSGAAGMAAIVAAIVAGAAIPAAKMRKNGGKNDEENVE